MINIVFLTILYTFLIILLSCIITQKIRDKLCASLNFPKPSKMQRQTVLKVFLLPILILILTFILSNFYEESTVMKMEYAILLTAFILFITSAFYVLYSIKKHQLYTVFDFGVINYLLLMFNAIITSNMSFLKEMPCLLWTSASWIVYSIFSFACIVTLTIYTTVTFFRPGMKKSLKEVWN